MSIYEYDEELHNKTLHDEGYEDGFSDGFNDGFNDGFDDGFNDGFSNGELSNLIKMICRKLQKNKSPQVIAEELEEDLDTVQRICDASKDFAPEYDVKSIMEQLQLYHPVGK